MNDTVPYTGAMLYRIQDRHDALAASFITYCAAHAAEHDESYIPDAAWAFGDDYPSFVLIDDAGAVIGAAAAMLGPSFRSARRARVAILHTCAAPAPEHYGMLAHALTQAVEPHADELYLFFPEIDRAFRTALDQSGFRFDRSVYLMGTTTTRALEPELPAGYTFSPVAPGDTAAITAFVEVRNRNFKEVHGSSDSRVEDILEFVASAEFLSGGLLLLHAPDSSPCGTLRVERDDDGTAFIGTISVDRAHRGIGLGKAIINKAVSVARAAGFAEAFLSVNATNTAALGLYEHNGFSVAKAMVCYAMRLPCKG